MKSFVFVKTFLEFRAENCSKSSGTETGAQKDEEAVRLRYDICYILIQLKRGIIEYFCIWRHCIFHLEFIVRCRFRLNLLIGLI